METFLLRQLNGTATQFLYDPTLTINELKISIKQMFGFEVDDQRLISSGKGLGEGDRALQDYGIQPNDTVHLILRLRNGSNANATSSTAKLETTTAEMTKQPPRDEPEKEKENWKDVETYADIIWWRRGAKF